MLRQKTVMGLGMRIESTGGDWIHSYQTEKKAMNVLLLLLVILCAVHSQRVVTEKAGPQHTIELVVVMDKMAFDSWHERSAGKEISYNVTLSRMADFMTSAVKGVNRLFQSLSQYGLHLDVRLKKLHVLNHDSWKNANLGVGQGNRISSDTALEQFFDWSVRVRSRLGPFDHAILLTGYDLINPKNPDDPIQGVAYKKVMCQEASVSMVENNFTYQVINTMAHELGHSLGAYHDEKTRCRNSHGHVMFARTEVNSTNRWSFSPCSADAMKLYIAKMNRENTNCLVKTTTRPTPGVRLGTLMEPDQQCRMIYGPQAFFCREFYRTPQAYEHMCSSFWCSSGPESNHCYNYIASDGFVCGNDKVCTRGKCSVVKTPQSTPVSDSCPQGDQPGPVQENLTCSQITSSQPWLCYNDVFRAKCCHSCARAKVGVPGCEYEDKADWCSTKMKYPFDCYRNNDTCCKSCQQYRQENKPGCEYGDHSDECQTKLEIPLGCYTNEALCCESCAKAKSATNPECPYGDRSTWCRDKLEVPYGCYLNRDLCCGTCGTLANDMYSGTTTNTTSLNGCEFGDKAAWCATEMNYPFDCYNNNGTCCKSCQQYRQKHQPGCEYGDHHKRCEDLVYPYACYSPDNAKECCHICGQYRNTSRSDCLYGDREAFCYKMNEKYAKEQWCPLDAENGHCCGTCLYDETAIPVFGSRVKELGLPVPK